MLRSSAKAAALVAASWAAVAAGCPCCPTCMPVYCPCACEACGDVPTAPPPGPTQGPLVAPIEVTTPAPPVEVLPTAAPTPPPPPPPPPGPLLQCDLNCFGEGATAVPLPGGDGGGVKAETVEVCRDFCFATEGCQAVVYGQGMCWGKKDVRTSKCAQGGGAYQTQLLTSLPWGTCTLMGDPHVLGFDNPNGIMGDITQLSAGDYWVLKSESLQIHGRFGYSARFPSEASTTGIAVSGPLIQGNKLVVSYAGPAKGYGGFRVSWNGNTILGNGFPDAYKSPDGLLESKLDNMNPQDFHSQARHTIGGTEGNLPSYLFTIVPNIKIYVLVGDETVNAVINLRRPDGEIDGYCGNFNCDPGDDTMDAVSARGLAAPIKGATLFSDAPPPPTSQTQKGGATMDINNCPPELLARAQTACESAGPEAKQGCVFDVCAAGDAAVAKEDVVTSAVEQDVTQHFELFGALRLPKLLGVSVPAQMQWAAAAMMAMFAFGGVAVGWKSKRGDLREGGFLRVAGEEAAEDEEALLGPASEFDALGS